MNYTMKVMTHAISLIVAMAMIVASCAAADDDTSGDRRGAERSGPAKVQLGPRPFYLVDKMDPGRLKRELQQCARGPFFKTDFSIGHRGAPMQFPEHTKESYIAAARMGAGIVECDVTFTKDGELVCRHSQCDLHTTTNILATDLASQCTTPFTPADPATGKRASARCCTSDITLAQFKTLKGKMDASNRNATTVEAYLGGTANWRTDLYATGGTLMTHKQSIRLFKRLGVKYTPELKAPKVAMPFDTDGDGIGDFTQKNYAQKMIDEYKRAGIPPRHVWAQSFNPDDVRYWIKNEPRFGKQAVYLDDRYETLPGFDPNDSATWKPTMEEFVRDGVRIIAPPMWVLLTLDKSGRIVPSAYAKGARRAGLKIITWTLERSGRIVEDVLPSKGTASPSFYYQSILDALRNDGDIMVTLDVLAKKVGIIGIFSDWPATVSYYASCMKLK